MEKKLLNTGPSERGAHRLESALKCATLYAFTKRTPPPGTEAATTPATGDALIRGSIGHVALAHHYARLGCEQNGLDPEEFYSPHDAIDIVAPTFGSTGKRFAPLIHDAYNAYGSFYAVERHAVAAVESPVRIMVPKPDGSGEHLFTQRWDLVTKDASGRLWVTDHKFVAKIEARTIERYALSIQFVGMVYTARRLLGAQFGGVKLNLVGVGNAQSFSFRRESVPPAPDAERRFPATVDYAERRIAEIEALASPWDAPRVFSETVCMSAYGPCSCYERCRWGQGHITMDGRTL
jgi:hypothetical protein